MSRYLDPKADVCFKKIFGEHPHLLISFLNALLPLPEDKPIVELEYLSAEQIPQIPAFKRTIADVKCKDSTGRVFIVEMQIDWTNHFKQRLLFGTSQAIVKQLEKGESYQFLQPVYGLGIIADIFESDTNQWYHHYRLVKESEEKSDVIEHLQLIFVELPKFQVKSSDAKKLRRLWLRFLREIDENTKEVSKDLLNIPEISQAVVLCEESAYSKEELYSYETYWDSVRTEKTLLAGRFEEGMAEGIAQGIAQGKIEGKNERNIEIALTMLKEHEPLEKISKFTGLSIQELQNLKL